MKCFEIVGKVLTSIYSQIPGDQAQRDLEVLKRLESLTVTYRNDLTTTGGPDFSDPITRFAYVYVYVPVNAHWLYELITWSEDVQQLFKGERLRATCLGGGPGSDMVGILKYMDKNDLHPSLFCEIVDGCQDWKATWSDLAFEIDWNGPVHTDYVIHDVADVKTWAFPWNLAKSDLITVSFFWSEIFYLGATAEKYLKSALDTAKPGALLLYNDNNHSRFSESFDAISHAAGFEQLLADSGERKVYDWNEVVADLGDFSKKFDRKPKLTGKVAWRVLRKVL